MKTVPRRLLVLGGGSAGVEIAQIVRRLGGEVALVEGAPRLIPREAAPLGDALSAGAAQGGHRARTSGCAPPPPGATATSTSCSSTTAGSCAATGCLWRPAGARGSRGSAWRRSASRSTRGRGSRSTTTCARASGCGRSATSTASGRSPTSASTRATWSRPTSPARTARPTTRRCRGSPTPIRRRRRWARIEAQYSGTAQLSEVPKTATYTHAYADSNGFLTLLSDGERLTGAYGLGPEAGEWMQQATLAIRARVPVAVLNDTIQPFPSFSGIYSAAVQCLVMNIKDMPQPTTPMDAQMANMPVASARDRRARAGAGRADRRRDRRQLGDRAGDGPARDGRGRRRHPHRPQSRPAGPGRAGTGSAAHGRVRRHRRGCPGGILPRSAGADRPCDGHRRRPVLQPDPEDGLGARSARRSPTTPR